MKSNYSQLGRYIREINVRNTDLTVTNLLGVSMEKTFIPSVANIIDVDLSVYKIIKKDQLACKLMSVGRDEKLPVDLYKGEKPSIVSSAYYVFEPKDKEELLPEFLMMWLCRPENDRYIGFISGSDVRGGISWDTFCSLPINVPSVAKQKEIVKEYAIVQNRITLNQQLIQKLEETAQAIYKHWFVDFEFPDETGRPYKSSGGEMVWSEELGKEIPKGWDVGKLGNLFDVINGYAFSSEDFLANGEYPIIKITNIVSPNIDLESTQYYSGLIDNKLQKCLVNQDDVLISMTGSHMNQINSAVGKIGRYNYEFSALLNQRVGKLKPKIRCNEFLFQTMLQENVQKAILMAATGSANQANISPDTIKGVYSVLPDKEILLSYEDTAFKLRKVNSNCDKQNRKLTELKDLLLSKLATIEN